MENRLCYILPKYDESSEEHFYHIFDFLEEVAGRIDLYLIVEKCIGYPKIKGVKHLYIQRCSRRLLRMAESAAVLLHVRLKGYKKFFVHYSYYGGILASAITRIVRGEVYYWNCGLAKQFFRPWRPTRGSLAEKLTAEIPLRLTLRLVDHLVTGTEGMARYYAENFSVDEERIIVIPNEINLARFTPWTLRREELRRQLGLGGDERVVLFVHRLAERKGAHHLPAIVEKVSSRHPSTRFFIVGGGPYEEKLKAELRERRIERKVWLLGWIANREIPRYYVVADLFIMPSEEEGFPRVLLEAMAMGVPFVATDVGGVREIVTAGQQRFLAARGDLEAFCQKVIALLEDDAERGRLREEGFANIQKYSTEKVVEVFLKQVVYDDRGYKRRPD